MAKRILIIDDERDMQIYLRTLFRRVGYETAVAANGEEGLELAKTFQPHLITLDLLMPKKSGVLAYEGLRAMPETRKIPVFIVSGLAGNEEMFRGATADLPLPEAVVDKPIDRGALLKKVVEVIGAEEAAQERR